MTDQLLDLRTQFFDPVHVVELRHDDCIRTLPFEIVADPNDCALGNTRMFGNSRLDLPRRHPMPGDVHHVISAAENVYVPVLVDMAAVAGVIVSGVLVQI